MELIKSSGQNIPIHAIPPAKWDEVICKGLIPKILLLLSIDVSKNQDRIAATELMIKESANRITPAEIEKAFMMYVKCQLPGLEPKDNYLSPILFTKVINSYKVYAVKPKREYAEPELTQEEKDALVYSGCVNCYDAWYQDKRIKPGYNWVYDHLDEKGVLNYSKDEKNDAMKEAKIRLKTQRTLIEKSVSKIEGGEVAEAKRILLEKYFESTTKDEFLKQL